MRGLRGVLYAVAIAACSCFALPAATAAPEATANWSGYAFPAKAGEAITSVSGSWHVPALKDAPPGMSSSWIGIGGYRTQDLIQIGTASNGLLGGNHAWYEMLPANETPIRSGCAGDATCDVASGDRMTASVTNTGGTAWQLSIVNYGKGSSPKWTWSKGVSYNSTRSSAEMIFEAPRLGAAGVGTQTTPANAPHAKFLGGATVVVNGVSRSFVSMKPIRIVMNDPFFLLVRLATPSLMAADGHFQVCAYKRTCPNF
jgi:hypothetical protein